MRWYSSTVKRRLLTSSLALVSTKASRLALTDEYTGEREMGAGVDDRPDGRIALWRFA
jgi:hypothetical protein